MTGRVIVSSGISANELLERLANVRHAGAMILADCPASDQRHEFRLLPLGFDADAGVCASCTGGCHPEALIAAIAGRPLTPPGSLSPSVLAGGSTGSVDAPARADADRGATASTMLSLPQAGRELGLHPRTVRARIRDGSLPGSFLGGRWRIRAADLTAFVARGAPETAEVCPCERCRNVSPKDEGEGERRNP